MNRIVIFLLVFREKESRYCQADGGASRERLLSIRQIIFYVLL